MKNPRPPPLVPPIWLPPPEIISAATTTSHVIPMPTAEPTTIEHMVDHIDHVARLVGIEHVGIGSDADLDGYDDMPAEQLKQLRAAYKASYAFRDKIDTDGFDHPRKTYELAEALIRRGYSDEHIGLVLGGNFRRLLATAWTAMPAAAAAPNPGN